MKERILTCIVCPKGCTLNVTLDERGGVVSVSGNTCPRGAVYAKQECTLPERMITAVVPITNRNIPLSVKTSSPVPKELIPDIMKMIGSLHLSAPITLGEAVISDILHTGTDIVATRNVF